MNNYTNAQQKLGENNIPYGKIILKVAIIIILFYHISANVLGMMPGIKAENWPLGLTNHAYPYHGYDPTPTLPITSSAHAVAANVLSSTH